MPIAGGAGGGSADKSAEPGRRRSRRLVAGIGSAALSRGLGGAVPIALIPITLGYLGSELYGLWSAVVALTGMVAFADLGLGNGLMTKLAPCYSTGDTERARRYISSAYMSLVAVAVALCGAVWLSAAFLSWSSLFNVSGAVTQSDARAMSLVCLTVFIVNVPLSLVIRVEYAYQEVARSNLWQSAGVLVGLPLTLVAVKTHLPPVFVVGATVVGPLLANIANSVWFFGHHRPEVAPSVKHVDRAVASSLLRLSGLFLVLTVITSAATNVDPLVITQALGLQSTTAYAVPARVFAMLGFLVTLINIPFWAAAGDALANGHVLWVRRLTRRMTLFSLGSVAAAGALLVGAGADVVGLLGGLSRGDHWLMAGLAAWWTLFAGISPRFMVQNAAGVLRPQLVGWVLYLVISIPLKWYLARLLGLAAIPWTGVAVYSVTVLPFAMYGYLAAIKSKRAAPTDGGDRDGASRDLVEV